MVMLISIGRIACSPTDGQMTAETESAPELDNKEFERRLAELRQKGKSREAVRPTTSFCMPLPFPFAAQFRLTTIAREFCDA